MHSIGKTIYRLRKEMNTRDLEPIRDTDRFKALIEKANKI